MKNEKKHKKLNILVSAFACRAGDGSEEGVGWNWIKELSKYNYIHVITDLENKNNIEENISLLCERNVKFYYVSLPNVFNKFKKNFWGLHIYYQLWQFSAEKIAKLLIKEIKFDFGHHITYATYKNSTFLANLNIPYILGPVGGGEEAPMCFYKTFPLKGVIKEVIRSIEIYLCKYNFLIYNSWQKATRILVTTEQTKDKLPKKFNNKIDIMQTIGVEDINNRVIRKRTDKFRILFAGNLLWWKGIYFLADVLKEYSKINDNIELVILGDGAERTKLENKFKKLSLSDKVVFLGRLDRDRVFDYYKDSDVMIFPSLHDSGAMVILEAMSYMLPIICLDLGGPGQNIQAEYGIKINAKDYKKALKESVLALDFIYNNYDEAMIMAEKAYEVIKNKFMWSVKGKEMQNKYYEYLGELLINK